MSRNAAHCLCDTVNLLLYYEFHKYVKTSMLYLECQYNVRFHNTLHHDSNYRFLTRNLLHYRFLVNQKIVNEYHAKGTLLRSLLYFYCKRYEFKGTGVSC